MKNYKLQHNYKIIVILTTIFVTLSCNSNRLIYVQNLRCEHLANPLGINSRQPRFSWINISDQQGSAQTSYQIIVASEKDILTEDKNDYWNSGKVNSSQNHLITYKGKDLKSGQILYWKVRVWDQNDNVSEWSEPSRLSIGLLTPQDWKASYIGFIDSNITENKSNINSETGSQVLNGFNLTPQFRKQFSVIAPDKKETYLLHINSLGYHEVYLNGKQVSDNVLSPAVSQFNKRSLINTYDVTEFIKSGQNDIIVWLGSGWYTDGLPGVTASGPAFKAQLDKVSNKTISNVIVTDETWTARNSEYERIGNWRSGRYGGEIINGNLETRNLFLESPDELVWNKVSLVDIPVHEVTPQMTEPNRIKDTISPISAVRLSENTYLIDMGTTISGWFEITFPELEKNQEIIMEFSDHLTNDGEIYWQGQIDKYIASGSGTEHFINKFNYHGFRYVKITNLNQEPKLSDIKAHFIHTDFESTSSFISSDEDLNQIHDMISYTLRNVGLGGYLVDCPQIERLGYGGDGNASTITAQTMFNLAPMYNNWIQAWGDVIREDGGMPHTAPNPYSAGGGPYWCGFIISASWNTYKNYADKRILEKYYPVMLKWLEYVDRYCIDGLLKKWPNTDYRNWYLGDWATPEGVGDPNHLDEASVDLVSNCYLSVCLNQMEEIASVLGKEEDKKKFSEKKAELNRKIHENFYNAADGYYATGSQIDIIFPMLCGAAPEELHENLIEILVKRTAEKFNGHLNTGLVGIPVMMEWAATANKPNFVYSMLKKKSYPGYLYMIENGATTTWEHWNGNRSRIHNCFNGVGQWFYQVVGGIRIVDNIPAYKKFLIDPQIPEGVTWAKTSQMTPYGMIEVNWELFETRMQLDVKVPVGATGILQIPEYTSEVIVNSEIIFSRSLGVSNPVDQFELSSGNHTIEFRF